MRRAAMATLLAAGGLAASAGAASAATEVGQPVTVNVLGQCVVGTELAVQSATSSGTSYAVAVDGTLTSFSTKAWAPAGPLGAEAVLHLAVYRPDTSTPAPNDYIVVGVSEGLTLGDSAPASPIVTPITPIAVKAGDLLGIVNETNSIDRCARFTGSNGDDVDVSFDVGGGPPPVAGDIVTLDAPPLSDNFRLSIAASFVPSCDAALVPVGCWHFDEATGPTAVDSSPFANNGSYLGNPALGTAGVAGTSVAMDGVNDSVRVPDSNSLDVNDDFTLEAWIKRTSTTKSFELMNKGGTAFQLSVMNAGNGYQAWLRRANGTTIAKSTAPVPADGRYHQIVVTRNGTGAGNTVIYIDGVAGTTIVSPITATANTTSLMTFGNVAGAPANFDEFAIYDSVLTQAQVDDLYAAGAAPVVAPT